MSKAQQELLKLKNRVTECAHAIATHKAEIRLLEGEILGLRTAIESLEPFLQEVQP